jgi:pyruvate/2-oxoglutarate dehydrogenase complex dihydrolipoamide acyltransferase (E2) component
MGGEAVERDYLSLTVSFDHRMIDAAPAARFTERLKQLLENADALRDEMTDPSSPRAERQGEMITTA